MNRSIRYINIKIVHFQERIFIKKLKNVLLCYFVYIVKLFYYGYYYLIEKKMVIIVIDYMIILI